MSDDYELSGTLPKDLSERAIEIAVLAGDGIGLDVTRAAVEVLAALQSSFSAVRLRFTEHSAGASEFLKSGDPLPAAVFDACRSADAVLLGAMGLPNVRWPDGKEMTPQIDLRERLDLYCGLRPIRLFHADDSPLKGYRAGEIDFLIVRENCEGLFSARHSQRDLQADEVRDVMLISRRGAERIVRAAFHEARKRRKKVTLVDKANVLPSMVFFREVFFGVAKEFPDITPDAIYVDAAALYLVKDPRRFDVIVTENIFGDILSDLAAGLIGGMGMAPSADLGSDCAVFQPSHGTAPDIAGKAIANPVATILSAAMMLEWLAHPELVAGAQRIRHAVEAVFADPANRTPDMGGRLTTRQITEKILACL
jgi:3-isopropylmalate dehydrogenase